MTKMHRDDDGKLPAYAWPGGYQILYYMADGECLCPACANGENGSLASETADERNWRIVGQDIFYEGAAEVCTHCNAIIESAYGNPEAEEESA